MSNPPSLNSPTSSTRIEDLTSRLPSLSRVAEFHTLTRGNGGAKKVSCPYYAGVQYAMAGRLDEAERLLQEACKRQDVAEPAARALAELYRFQAEEKLRQKDLGGAADLLSRAQGLDPNNARLKNLSNTLGFALPAFHVKDGKRKLAVEVWSKAFKENPSDSRAAHALALVHFWWAKELVSAGKFDEAAAAWQASAEYWSMILRSSNFHQACAHGKTQSYDKKVEPQQVEDACKNATVSILRTIKSIADENGNGHSGQSRRIVMRAYGLVMRELRGAEMLCDAVALLGSRSPKGVRIGGPGALTKYGGLELAQQVAEAASQTKLDPDAVAKIKLAYSRDGETWGFLEAKLFDEVVAELKPVKSRSAVQNELLARAYVAQGALARDEIGSLRSFELWAEALKCMGGSKPASLISEIEENAAAASRDACRNAKKAGIRALRSHIASMRDLCKLLGTTPMKVGLSEALNSLALAEHREGNTNKVKGLLEEALTLNSKNQNVKLGLSSLLSGEAVDKANKAVERANRSSYPDSYQLKGEIREAGNLFSRALDLDPNNQHARENYAKVLQTMVQLEMWDDVLKGKNKLGM